VLTCEDRTLWVVEPCLGLWPTEISGRGGGNLVECSARSAPDKKGEERPSVVDKRTPSRQPAKPTIASARSLVPCPSRIREQSSPVGDCSEGVAVPRCANRQEFLDKVDSEYVASGESRFDGFWGMFRSSGKLRS
jgi:hypothetical protein